MKHTAKRILSFICVLCLLLADGGGMMPQVLSAGADAAYSATREVTASDGKTYAVSVTCDDDSIPVDAVLHVTELTDDSRSAYVAESAELLGAEPKDFTLARAFDISLCDPETGVEYQPGGSVRVSIALLDADLDAEEAVHVVHFGDEPELLSSSRNGKAVEFDTESFSVYVVVSGSTRFITYSFYQWDESREVWESIPFYTEGSATPIFVQTVKYGEKPLIPQCTAVEGKSFAGWYRGTVSGGTVVLDDAPYDFDKAFDELTEDTDSVDLYAEFKPYATIYFHDQFDSEYGDFPVSHIRRAELVDTGAGAEATVNISALSATYSGSEGGDDMAFYGWSLTKISTPGADLDDDGHPVTKIVPDANGNITVDGDTSLYPIFKRIHWLTFYGAQSGLGASYNAPKSLFVGEGIPKLPTSERDNYTFHGWYTGVLTTTQGPDDKPIEHVTYLVQVSDANGNLMEGINSNGVSTYTKEGDDTLKLFLENGATLYAKWQANYNVVTWVQKTTDTRDASPKTYEHAYTVTRDAEIGDTVYLTDFDRTRTIAGYAYAGCDCVDGKVIGNTLDRTVLNVYYDLVPEMFDTDGNYIPAGSEHILAFRNPAKENPYAVQSMAYGASLSALLPPTPGDAPDHYSFSGWYADPDCMYRVFFDEDSYLELDKKESDRIPTDRKLLYTSMPDHDLTLYAGWETEWYIVTIDPNYGALYAYNDEGTELVGSGATWFWSSYSGEPVGEYTHATRDYVKSTSGTWYYVNHTGSSYENRYTYYTQDPGEATEDTTFERVPGSYTYAGWYEVNPDGTETPYDFSRHVEYYLTLRLHWKKNGAYYIAFSAGNGSIAEAPDKKELLLPDAFTDYADMTLSCAAAAPEGYTFVGWRLRNSTDSTIYGVGDTFTLHADDAVRVSGRDIVYLDAVYQKLGTAEIFYDANGGDAGAGADTHARYANNSLITLSDGTGYSYVKDGVNLTLEGWCSKPVCGAGDTLFELGGSYGVDSAEPNTLYAIWGVPVTYHLNPPSADATWGGEWDSGTYTYSSEDNTYHRTAYLNAPLAEPECVPTDPNSAFLCWTTSADGTAAYDFSAAVTAGRLDLYARWDASLALPVHAVDASGETLADVTSAAGWTIDSKVRAGEKALTATSHVTAPDGYAFAFAAVSASLDSVSPDREAVAVKYDSSIQKICVKYKGSDSFTPLAEGENIYFVYYLEKTLTVGYQKMLSSGELVAVTSSGPTSVAESLGKYHVSGTLEYPLGYAGYGTYSNFSYAVGRPGAGNAGDLSMITRAINNDANRPSLLLRNTWRGFEYSEDGGASWMSCGYDVQVYVLYYDQSPSVITFREQTLGPRSAMQDQFEYSIVVTDSTGAQLFPNDTNSNNTYYLSNGESQTAILFYRPDGPYTQTITVTQRPKDGYVTELSYTVASDTTPPYVWTYTTGSTTQNPTVTFTNKKELTLELHLAMVNEDNAVVNQDSLRADGSYTYTVVPGQTQSLLTIPPIYYVGAGEDYALYGNAAYGTGSGSAVTLNGLNAVSVSYLNPKSSESNLYELYLNCSDGTQRALGSDQIYMLYYLQPKVQYLKDIGDGTLAQVEGYASADRPTYDRRGVTANGYDVVHNQAITLPVGGLLISQSGDNNAFRMPPILDDGSYVRYLSYTRLGADDSSVTDNFTAGLAIRLRLSANGMQWSKNDGQTWNAFHGRPTIYAVYSERGYDLQINKTVDVSQSGANPIFTDTEFTVTIRSAAITKELYSIDGYQEATIRAIRATATEPGSITLTKVRDGSKIRIIALGRGDYTVTESGNDNYDLSAKRGSIVGSTADDVDVALNADGGIELALDSGVRLELINAPKALCKVVDEGGTEHLFYTLNSAISYIGETDSDRTAGIEMLSDYLMPTADALVIPNAHNITLTTASEGSYRYPGVEQGKTATISRSGALTGAMFTNNGTLKFENITIDGKLVEATAPMIQSAGALTIGKGTKLENALNTGNGGAINATAGDIEIDEAELLNNSAASGGAIYSGSSGISLSGTTSFSGNIATAGDGGAICALGGSISLDGTSSLSNNRAENGNGGAIYIGSGLLTMRRGSFSANHAGSGGAIYSGSAAIEISGGALSGNYAATGNGGAIYSGSGAIEISGGTLSGNYATAGNGGAIFTDSGAVVISNGALTGNYANAGNGGALYSNIGTVTFSGGTIGGTGEGVANSAINGAAIFVEAKSATLSGGTITGNTASDGGAVGVGVDENDATASKLYFSGKIKVTGNTGKDGVASNVYLNADSDGVINAAGLASDASVGIYVPDKKNAEGVEYLFKNRGGMGARFGIYSSDTNVSKFKNDRQPSLNITKDTVSMRLIWGTSIKVQVYKLDNYSAYPNGFPPTAKGTSVYTNNSYYPSQSSSATSELGEDLREHYPNVNVGSTVFGAAFLSDGTDYRNDFITRLLWEDTNGDGNYIWKVEKRDGTKEPLGDRTLYLFYSNPAFISIENNTDVTLNVSSMTVLAQSVINHYGLVFAKNGTLQSALLPVAAGDLSLAPGESIIILVPGGRSKSYSLQGSFAGTFQEDIRLRRTSGTSLTEETILKDAAGSFPLSGTTLNDSATYEIIFGDDKYICQIQKNNETFKFPSFSAAVNKAHEMGWTEITIEMLVDYMVRENDVLSIPATDSIVNITLTSAASLNRRAVISRDAKNLSKTLITVNGTTSPKDQIDKSLTIHDLDFDGKSVSGTCDGGAIKTNNCTVAITNSNYRNFIANNGGAIYVSFGNEKSGNIATYFNSNVNTEAGAYAAATLSIIHADFYNCESKAGSNRCGGGAVWTNGISLHLEDCSFDKCVAKDQGGAVFHRIEIEAKNGYAKYPYYKDSATTIKDCHFSNCKANAAGGIESDALNIRCEDSSFSQCSAIARGGGGFNIYIHDSADSKEPSQVYVKNSQFYSCTAARDGGGLCCGAMKTTVEDCTFSNCKVNSNTKGKGGGGICFKNVNATEAKLLGTTIIGCSIVTSNGYPNGGGLMCHALDFTVGKSEAGNPTVISGCSAKAGGGIYYDRGSGTITISDTTIDSCTATENGGGIETLNNQTTSLNNTTIQNCTASQYGGGVYTKTNSTELKDSTVQNCTGTKSGGGINISLDKPLILDHTMIKGNTSANGGGISLKNRFEMKNGSEVTGNTLTVTDPLQGAGVYCQDNATLFFGANDKEFDILLIKDNTAKGGTSSDLRLPEQNNANKKCVTVYCSLTSPEKEGPASQIYVVNAKNVGVQFGTADNTGFRGLSDDDAVFRADNSTLHGIIDRADGTAKKIIWAGPPVCKITDGEGNLLYFKNNGSDPAIFDVVEDNKAAGSRTSAFALLRAQNVGTMKGPICNRNVMFYENGEEYMGSTYCVKMIVPEYTLTNQITTINSNSRTIILTTAGYEDPKYPYELSSGQATITRGTALTGSMILAKTNMELLSITLDGDSANTKSTENGGILRIDAGGVNVVLGTKATLERSESTGNGGAVYVANGSFKLSGGMIRFCDANNGGAVYTNVNNPEGFVFDAGNILRCTAAQDGGAVYVGNGGFLMKGQIEQCDAKRGGGVFVANDKSMTMSGTAKILRNTATEKGGGIYAGGPNARLYFKEKPAVSGNTSSASVAQNNTCNVELDSGFNNVLSTVDAGLQNGASIGVYVPGEEHEEHPESLYDFHGVQRMPFGHFPDSDRAATLYGFINDRNGLKGGLIENTDPNYAPNTIYWVRIFALTVQKEVDSSEKEHDSASEKTFEFQVTLSGTSTDGRIPATMIDGEYGSLTFHPDPDKEISLSDKFYLKAGEKITAENLPAGLHYSVKETSADGYAAFPASEITGRIAENAINTVSQAYWYESIVTFHNVLPVCKITNQYGNLVYQRYTYYRYQGAEGILYNVPAVFTDLNAALEALNGSLYPDDKMTTSAYSSTYDGFQIQMLVTDSTMQQASNVGKKVTLTTALKYDSSFPYRGSGTIATVRRGNYDDVSMFTVSGGGDLTLKNITLDGGKITTTADGGIVDVAGSSKLTVSTGATLRNSVAANGGAVYVAQNGEMTMDGGTVTDNKCTAEGAGIYLASGAKLNLSGAPNFGGAGADSFGNLNGKGNLRIVTMDDETNGGRTYRQARQDIYLKESGNDPASLILTGDITSGNGTIWVWADSAKHYEMLTPFAKTTRASLKPATYTAFRNAQTDKMTNASRDSGYLTGQSGANASFLYWNGGFDVVFYKIQPFTAANQYVPLKGARFSLTAQASGKRLVMESEANGRVLFKNVPSGTYTLVEEDPLPDGYANVNKSIVYTVIVSPSIAGKNFSIQRNDGDAMCQYNGNYLVMNIAKPERRVILKKSDLSFNALSEPEFEIMRCDWTHLRDGDSTTFSCGGSGVFFSGSLSYGTYYLHETKLKDGSAGDCWYTLTVDQNGIGRSQQLTVRPNPTFTPGT